MDSQLEIFWRGNLPIQRIFVDPSYRKFDYHLTLHHHTLDSSIRVFIFSVLLKIYESTSVPSSEAIIASGSAFIHIDSYS